MAGIVGMMKGTSKGSRASMVQDVRELAAQQPGKLHEPLQDATSVLEQAGFSASTGTALSTISRTALTTLSSPSHCPLFDEDEARNAVLQHSGCCQGLPGLVFDSAERCSATPETDGPADLSCAPCLGPRPRRLDRLYIKARAATNQCHAAALNSCESSSSDSAGRSMRLTPVNLRVTSSAGSHASISGMAADVGAGRQASRGVRLGEDDERSVTVTADDLFSDARVGQPVAEDPFDGVKPLVAISGTPAHVRTSSHSSLDVASGSPPARPLPASTAAASRAMEHASSGVTHAASPLAALAVAAAAAAFTRPTEDAPGPLAPSATPRRASCRISMKLHSSRIEQLKPSMLPALARLLLPYDWALKGFAVRSGCVELVLDYTRLEGQEPGMGPSADPHGLLADVTVLPEQLVAQLVSHLHQQGLVDPSLEPRVAVQVNQQMRLVQCQDGVWAQLPGSEGGPISLASWCTGAGAAATDEPSPPLAAGGWRCSDLPAYDAALDVELFVAPACSLAPSAAGDASLVLYVGVPCAGMHSCSVRALGRFLPVRELHHLTALAAADKAAEAVACDAGSVEDHVDWALAAAAAVAAGVDGEVFIISVRDLPSCCALLQVELRMRTDMESWSSEASGALSTDAVGDAAGQQARAQQQQPVSAAELPTAAAPVLLLHSRCSGETGSRGGSASGQDAERHGAGQEAERLCSAGGVGGEWTVEQAAGAAQELSGLRARMVAGHASASDAALATKEFLFDMGLLLDSVGCSETAEAEAEGGIAGQDQQGLQSNSVELAAFVYPSYSDTIRAVLLVQLGMAGGPRGDGLDESGHTALLKQQLADTAVTLLAGCAELSLPYTARLVASYVSQRLRLGGVEAMVQAAADGDAGLAARLQGLLRVEQLQQQRAVSMSGVRDEADGFSQGYLPAMAMAPRLPGPPRSHSMGRDGPQTAMVLARGVGASSVMSAFAPRLSTSTSDLDVPIPSFSFSMPGSMSGARQFDGIPGAHDSVPAATSQPPRYQRFAKALMASSNTQMAAGDEVASVAARGDSRQAAAEDGAPGGSTTSGTGDVSLCTSRDGLHPGQPPQQHAPQATAATHCGCGMRSKVEGAGVDGAEVNGAEVEGAEVDGAEAAAAARARDVGDLIVGAVLVDSRAPRTSRTGPTERRGTDHRPPARTLLQEFGEQVVASFTGYSSPAMEQAFWLDATERLQPMCRLYAGMTLAFVSLAMVRAFSEDGLVAAAFMAVYQGGQAVLLAVFGLWGDGRPGRLFGAVVSSTVLRCVCHALLSRGLAPLPSFVLPVCRAGGDLFNEAVSKSVFEQLPVWLFVTMLVFLEVPTTYALYMYMDGNGRGLLTDSMALRTVSFTALKIMVAVGTQAVQRMRFKARTGGGKLE